MGLEGNGSKKIERERKKRISKLVENGKLKGVSKLARYLQISS